jgi:hypothetical protein
VICKGLFDFPQQIFCFFTALAFCRNLSTCGFELGAECFNFVGERFDVLRRR